MKKLLGTLPPAVLITAPAFAQIQWVVLDETLRSGNSSATRTKSRTGYGSNARKIGEMDAVLGDDPSTVSELAIDFDDADAFVDGEVEVAPDRFSLNIDRTGARQLEPWNH